jgi:cell fate (sporulation/competence/biofilm development) regulator YlbF (YheA/YmcA/DUF963 family)
VTHANIDGAVPTAATALARAIQETPEWIELRSAQQAFEADPDVTRLMSRYQELFGRWRSAQARGSGLSGNEAMELAQVQEDIQEHPLFLRHQGAMGELAAVLQRANEVLSSELGIDFAASAAPRRGGCCG